MLIVRRSRLAETAAVTAWLATIAALVYGSYVVQGGFLSDAWANLAVFEYAPGSGFWDTLSSYLTTQPNIAARPLRAVFLVVLFEAFGSNAHFWLGLQVASNVLMALMLYLLLRRLSLAAFDAILIAALVLIFPAASSLRFWTPMIWASLSISCVVAGFLLALLAFERQGGRSLFLHGASLTCFVSSLLFYEVGVPLILVSVLLYRSKVSWASALRRWGVDVGIVLSVIAIVGGSSPAAKDVQSVSGMWNHATEIFDQAWTLLAVDILPFSISRWYALVFLAVVAALAAIAVACRAPADLVRAQLRRWVAVGAAGFIVVIGGYAVFVPGIDYYAPMAPGIGDRVNAVPSIGWVLVLYASIAIVATLVFRRAAQARVLTPLATAAASALIGIGWLQQIDRDSDNYTAAFREAERVRSVVATAIPNPAPDSTIWTFGQPVEMAPGIPVFGNTWDMTSSIQLTYGDPTIRSYVGFPGTTFDCRPKSIVPGGNASYRAELPRGTPNPFASTYGRTVFVDTTSARAERIRTPTQCRAAARSFPRSPSYPGEPPPSPTRGAPSPSVPYRLTPGGKALIDPQGQRIPIAQNVVTGFVDNVIPEGEAISLTGWAAAGNLSAPARHVVAVVGEAEVGQSSPSSERPDVVDAYDAPAIKRSGFTLYVEKSALECSKPAGGLTVFGIARGTATSLSMVGNSAQQLNASC